jgi:hypothetical protein
MVHQVLDASFGCVSIYHRAIELHVQAVNASTVGQVLIVNDPALSMPEFANVGLHTHLH